MRSRFAFILGLAAFAIGAILFVLSRPRHTQPTQRPLAVPSHGTAPMPESLAAQPQPTSPASRPRTDDDAFADFRVWSRDYLRTHSGNLAHGEALAIERRAALAKLIETDPERALVMAVPLAVRQALPHSIARHLEERVSGRADVYALAVLPATGVEPDLPPVSRTAVIGDKTYRMFTYGRRLALATKSGVSLHGIAVGDALAVHENPVRVLEPIEVARVRAENANEQHVCPVSGQSSTVNSDETLVEVGGEVLHLCGANHIAALAETLYGEESQPGEPGAAVTSWTQGPKTVLYVRARFNDQVSDPQTLTDASNMMASVNGFFVTNSYEQTTITATVIPDVYVLPYSTAQAVTNGIYKVRSDALAVAASNGYVYTSYNLDAVRYTGGPGAFSGAAYVGARGCWLKSSSVGVAAHEFGHNYGVWHANAWNSYNDSIIGPGVHVEYGDDFDTMGSAVAGNNHFNAWFKRLLNWLSPADMIAISNSGTYRVYAHDEVSATNQVRFLQVTRDSSKNYGIEFRQKLPGTPWIMNGAGLRWTLNYNSSLGSRLLDTMPGTSVYDQDSAIIIGRTFSDPMAGIHITTVGKGGTTPESLDVVVNFGTFPGNSPPTVAINASATSVGLNSNVTFSAAASDPDGDTLAYFWNFDDAKFTNTPTAVKSWNFAREYNVRCTVTDMKGGTASDSMIVTVGAPAGIYRISGQVHNGGLPVEGARVFASLNQQAYTDSDGSYAIAGLTNGNYTVNAVKYDFAMSAVGSSNATVGPSVNDIDFAGTPRTYSISGQAYDSEILLAGVIVTDGVHTGITDNSGSYTLSGLSSGYYTLTGSRPDYEIGGSFLNPVEINGTNVINIYFYRVLYSFYGSISGVGTSWVNVGIGDGVHEATSYGWIGQGGGTGGGGTGDTNNQYYVDVPRGVWNMVATLTGYTIAPLNFTNPMNVSTNWYPDYNFAGTLGASYVVSGTISNGVAAVVGAVVTDGTRASASDTLGKYMVVGVPAGGYTITPALDYYTFAPSNRLATVVAADSIGHDFTATPTPMGVWRNAKFTTVELADPGISGDTSDPDGDGIQNRIEYALHLEPKTPSLTGLPTVSATGDYLTITFTRVKSATDISYIVQVAGELGTWYSGPLYTEQVSVADNGDTETVTVRDLTPMNAAQARFIRLLISR